jgi:hypothetical protein
MIPQRASASDTAPSHNLVERLIRARRSSGVRTVLVHVVGGTPQGRAALTETLRSPRRAQPRWSSSTTPSRMRMPCCS